MNLAFENTFQATQWLQVRGFKRVRQSAKSSVFVNPDTGARVRVFEHDDRSVSVMSVRRRIRVKQ